MSKKEKYTGPIVNCVHGEPKPFNYEEIEKLKAESLQYRREKEAKRQKELAKSKNK